MHLLFLSKDSNCFGSTVLEEFQFVRDSHLPVPVHAGSMGHLVNLVVNTLPAFTVVLLALVSYSEKRALCLSRVLMMRIFFFI